MGEQYKRISKAIEYIINNIDEQPSLEDMANQIKLSPYHFQRTFSQWVGISPKRFLELLTVDNAKTLLDESTSILNTSNELGLSSSSRLSEQFISIEAVTPGEYKSGGDNLEIKFGIHPSPFGNMLIAITARGICNISFCNIDIKTAKNILRVYWPEANLFFSNKETQSIATKIFEQRFNAKKPLSLYVQGTNFQINVWRALLDIQVGEFKSYGDIAKKIDKPKAYRAVGTAVGANPIAYFIPCHRVIQSSGKIGKYRWGSTRKRAILCLENINKITK